MKTVLKVSDLIQKEDNKEGKSIVFTHHFNNEVGWEESCLSPDDSRLESIVYLGKCSFDGDMFAAYYFDGIISIYKGYLNDGNDYYTQTFKDK